MTFCSEKKCLCIANFGRNVVAMIARWPNIMKISRDIYCFGEFGSLLKERKVSCNWQILFC